MEDKKSVEVLFLEQMDTIFELKRAKKADETQILLAAQTLKIYFDMVMDSKKFLMEEDKHELAMELLISNELIKDSIEMMEADDEEWEGIVAVGTPFQADIIPKEHADSIDAVLDRSVEYYAEARAKLTKEARMIRELSDEDFEKYIKCL